MHYDALIHREITTHIARYISCGFNKNVSKFYNENQDNNTVCYDVIQSIINKIDHQITPLDRDIINNYHSSNISMDMIENLNAKEKEIYYLLDYYENNDFE